MVALLSVNTYDKDAYVDRWVEQCRSLDRSRWRLQVVKNGASDAEWHANGWETVRAANTSVSLGYRESLAATVVAPDVDVVVSVHAKTYLPDLALLDRMTDLGGSEVMTLDGWYPFEERGGECLLMFSVSASRWPDLVRQLASYPEGLWNEVVLGRAIADLKLDAARLPTGAALATQDVMSYWIRDIDGTGLDLYCCEPSDGNMGFGHYARPGGYRPIRVSPSGVVTDR